MRKRVRLGLGLGLGGETAGRLKLLPRKKGKVRVRVVDESMKTRNIFCLTTKDSHITEKNEFARYLTLTWDQPRRIPL